jgi:hypothetical protein
MTKNEIKPTMHMALYSPLIKKHIARLTVERLNLVSQGEHSIRYADQEIILTFHVERYSDELELWVEFFSDENHAQNRYRIDIIMRILLGDRMIAFASPQGVEERDILVKRYVDFFADHKSTLFGKTFPLQKEYEKYERGRTWYIAMGLVGLLLLTYALISGNNSFALIIILFGIVMYLHELHEPMDINFAITDTGIVLGKKYYRYSELENFWIVYGAEKNSTRNLYFTYNGYLKHRLQVSLLDYDPRPIRDYLTQYVVEDLEQEEEPLSDRVARLLKIH